jgi:cytochrome c biogenesis protein
VSVLEDGREVKRQEVLVNHPLSYQGIQFYQSSFGINTFLVKVTPASGPAQELHFPLEMAGGADADGSMYDIPEDGAVQFTAGKAAAIVARGFSPDGSEAGPMGGALPGGSGPAANLTLVSGFGPGGNHNFKDLGWVKQGQPVKAGAYTVELEPVHYYSGLIARRDVGVPLVWAGFALLVVGLMATFYFRPHSLVAGVTPAGYGSQVTLAVFEKGGAGQERWQARPHPVLGKILSDVELPGAGGEQQRRDDDEL